MAWQKSADEKKANCPHCGTEPSTAALPQSAPGPGKAAGNAMRVVAQYLVRIARIVNYPGPLAHRTRTPYFPAAALPLWVCFGRPLPGE
ncbi:hypothetical protein ColLi_03956 [Colletotrichum liriopes]|uniref:Uncharacterized protein n=1 Tax=Colletotrichum liriopes TaxID=708192 RepID=A0AA37LRB5_9PEZI|nr:hypothetical protein ColLi_03956 [Colletotrichum liriopes]